eukprot:TRINITY_DN468_c0_g4_i1.p1 TRINITY_DN468_c0_g4~~TRINITY_DN468_c0_g4_i1.p1  ORF type:complete len:244 (+),score=-22.93 TRINITY_DN468_c0_g4_i1:817-1548(+)
MKSPFQFWNIFLFECVFIQSLYPSGFFAFNRKYLNISFFSWYFFYLEKSLFSRCSNYQIAQIFCFFFIQVIFTLFKLSNSLIFYFAFFNISIYFLQLFDLNSSPQNSAQSRKRLQQTLRYLALRRIASMKIFSLFFKFPSFNEQFLFKLLVLCTVQYKGPLISTFFEMLNYLTPVQNKSHDFFRSLNHLLYKVQVKIQNILDFIILPQFSIVFSLILIHQTFHRSVKIYFYVLQNDPIHHYFF